MMGVWTWKRILWAGILISAVLAAGCLDGACIQGSGVVVTENRTTDAFDGIALSGIGTVYLAQGESTALSVEAEDNLVPYIRTQVVDGILTIDQRALCIRPTRPVIIRVSTPAVRRVANSGSGSVIGVGELSADTLDVAVTGSGSTDLRLSAASLSTLLSGSGTVTLRGSVPSHSVLVTGSGGVKAFDLETASTSVTGTGSGSAEVWATDELDARISGSGSVYYRGDPARITTDITGSGTVRKVE